MGQMREVLCTALSTYLGSSQGSKKTLCLLDVTIMALLAQGVTTSVARACVKPSHCWLKAEIMYCHPVGPV